MESKILAMKEISEEYTSNGVKKKRIHTVRTMDNNGSKFVNYRCGRQSVNISKNAFEELQKLDVSWKDTETTKVDSELHNENKQLQRQINELKKLIKEKK